MAKTYNTIPTVATGDLLTATAWNNQATNVNNYRVPPSCRVYRSSDLSGLAGGAFITWNAESWDTDDMWTSGSQLTVNTAGIYVVQTTLWITCTATITWMGCDIWRNSNTLGRNQAPAYNSTTGYITNTVIMPCSVGTTIASSYDPFGGSSHVVKGGADLTSNTTSTLTATWIGQVS